MSSTHLEFNLDRMKKLYDFIAENWMINIDGEDYDMMDVMKCIYANHINPIHEDIISMLQNGKDIPFETREHLFEVEYNRTLLQLDVFAQIMRDLEEDPALKDGAERRKATEEKYFIKEGEVSLFVSMDDSGNTSHKPYEGETIPHCY